MIAPVADHVELKPERLACRRRATSPSGQAETVESVNGTPACLRRAHGLAFRPAARSARQARWAQAPPAWPAACQNSWSKDQSAKHHAAPVGAARSRRDRRHCAAKSSRCRNRRRCIRTGSAAASAAQPRGNRRYWRRSLHWSPKRCASPRGMPQGHQPAAPPAATRPGHQRRINQPQRAERGVAGAICYQHARIGPQEPPAPRTNTSAAANRPSTSKVSRAPIRSSAASATSAA